MKNTFLILFVVITGFLSKEENHQTKVDIELNFDIKKAEDYHTIKKELLQYSTTQELSFIKKGKQIILKTKKGQCYKYAIKLTPKSVRYKYKGCKPKEKPIRKIFFDLVNKSPYVNKYKW